MLAVAVVGVMIGHSWVCKKCEDVSGKRRERLLAAGTADRPETCRPEEAARWRRQEPNVGGDRPMVWDAPPFRSHGYGGATLRGFVPPNASGEVYAAQMRHGQ